VQSATEAEIFTNLDLGMDFTPTQLINNDREESLSDVDVDLDELEAIPDNFIPPMLDEDGSPIPDSDSETSDVNTITHDEDSPTIPPQSPSADTIRLLIISVQRRRQRNANEKYPLLDPKSLKPPSISKYHHDGRASK
jgi:hypothetical protein